MTRRSPPTPLRLHNGPLPARGKPRHTLPSIPRPAFYGPAPTLAAGGPVPRARMTHTELPSLLIPVSTDPGAPSAFSALPMATTAISALEATWSGPSSPTSASSTASLPRKKSREFIRGPWDHSGAIHVPFDVGAVLPPPMPAAINVRAGEGEKGARRFVA
ncbi:hypothetical protein L226DRAFT_181106 [Lentinus tigrinus ALCF2SS1-7]|uniref:uncharacterized protein n=1 Tax=Lentinus tigrinus ALCF2SS1-7 TaxID=1328758 RepID=UPI001165DA5C|nr:hypothetical protein L226DRAFT_181106 [Lentinus tigrinus ALCF2SS1-7]